MRYISVSIVAACVSSPLFGQDLKVDLSDHNCGAEVLISIVDGAHIYASCVSIGAERIMRISVSNLARPDVGRLRDFSIGFCGPSVVDASAQNGWVAKVEGVERHTVTWSLTDDLVDTLGIPSRARVGGFVVRLKPGWKRSRSDSAWWGDSKIIAQVMTHDC
jgi:hypothetical protein